MDFDVELNIFIRI